MPSENAYSFNTLKNFISDNFSLLIIAIIIYGAGFFTGSLWTENSMLKGGTVAKGGTTTTTDTAAPDAGPTKEQLASIPAVSAEDHIRGNANAKVVMVEYSDYECPFCGRFHPTMATLKEEFGDDVAWVYRHYPLPFHPNAQKAAEASECVAQQGGNEAFWTYSDTVFEENQASGAITAETIQAGAEAAGVDMTAFNTCLDSGEMAGIVQTHMDAASAGGVSATPGTVVMTADGAQEVILGAYPIEQVRATIEKYL
ncbi:MAG: hypothetical protein QG639_54 [Patescibacteria group bacterium]|jgi:protein-disulfide isomerase|nr:hypothetical protein [Patescibacteria group bacterium]